MTVSTSNVSTNDVVVRSTIGSSARLVGRRTECELLDRLISDARAGTSDAIVVRGEVGIGKTALLDYLLAHAAGCRIARSAGVESEMELAFAGLHQLCAPFLDRLDRIPGPQTDALGTAFGLRVGDPPDRFLVGLAVLSLLSDVADAQPLVCLIDDAQWLDQASAQVLGFVARRLGAEAVVMIFAMRQPWEDRHFAGVPEVMVGPLRDQDARALLTSVMPGLLDVSVRERIVAEARGNPLALLELPKAWTPAAFAGGFGLPDTASVSGRIEESFRRRLSPLPERSRQLMLVAAAEPVGDPVLIRAAAERLGIGADAEVPAAATGLFDAGTPIRFRHPLVRSVIYRDASIVDRRLVHAALADATDPSLDPDRRAWHLAAAATGPDEAVAEELERSAGRAQGRGGVAAAAAFLQRAVALTQDPARQGERALAAGQASIQAGSFDAARALLLTAEGRAVGEFQRALVDLMRAQLAFASNRGNEATPLLLAAARRLEPLNLKLARETYLDAFSAALFGARLNERFGVPDVAAAARASARPADADATIADVLLDALVALSGDYAAAVAPSRDALRRLTSEGISPQERLRWLWQGCVIALEMWDDESAATLSERSVEAARETGTLSELALALSAYTPVLVLCGDLSAASAGVLETQSVEQATGIRSAPYGALILAAWRGESRNARELIDMTMRDAGARGEGIGVAVAEYARAVLSNGLGQYEEALDAARSASQYREVVVENWGLSELIEPATRAGRTDLAIDALDRLAAKAAATGTRWALGIEARSRALLSEGDAAEELFHKAIDHLSRTRLRTELARARLLFGEWLRREGRRVVAREQLRSAYEVFAAAGMDAFAERARAELLATGEHVRVRGFDTLDELTPQELQIARLASDGRSNPEIGGQLFLSPRTVEWHLRKVFSKLGISSRRELRKALPATDHAVT
jgi:DNA-binding CsgD family transcriptional regulator